MEKISLYSTVSSHSQLDHGADRVEVVGLRMVSCLHIVQKSQCCVGLGLADMPISMVLILFCFFQMKHGSLRTAVLH